MKTLRIPTIFSFVLLAGCAASVKQVYEGSRADREISIIESVGDVGFRIDRTIHNMKPSAYVEKINGMEMGSATYGFPTTVKALPGRTNLEVYCALPYGSADPKAPMERQGYGLYGTVSTFAKIRMDAELKAGKRYELKCESVAGYRARAWLDEASR
jgi:hypothetical protein